MVTDAKIGSLKSKTDTTNNNLFVIFAFSFDLIFLSIYVCDIGFEIGFDTVK